MNLLQLCQRCAVECGVASSVAIQTALPTVVGAAGSLGRIVNWVGDAWRDLQSDRDDWDFMRSSCLLGGGVSFQTIAGQASYPLGVPPVIVPAVPPAVPVVPPGTVGIAADAFGKWDTETFRCFATATGFAGEGSLSEISFDAWRNSFMMGAERLMQARPVVFAVGPDQSLCLGPPPNDLYTITADYFTAPSELVLDTDVPFGLPTRFHLLICYRAMMKYAGYESAPEVYQRGSQENAGMYAQLLAARAPRPAFGAALA